MKRVPVHLGLVQRVNKIQKMETKYVLRAGKIQKNTGASLRGQSRTNDSIKEFFPPMKMWQVTFCKEQLSNKKQIRSKRIWASKITFLELGMVAYSVIPATEEVEVGGSQSETDPNKSIRPNLKNS
jgi:hypothetical protein